MKTFDAAQEQGMVEAHLSPVARQAKITELVRRYERVTVNELAELLGSSKETIRRDLTVLSDAGKVQKFHGGALLPKTTEEGPFSERMGENVAAKTLIAGKAHEIVLPGETVFIDSGSTSIYFAEKMAEIPRLTVITNSSDIARIISLSGNRSTAFLLGGEYNGGNRQTVGSLALAQTTLFRAHHAVLTIGALDQYTGVMDYCIDEAQVAQAMIKQAQTVTIIADSSKFDRIASFKVCDLDRVDNLFCDQYPAAKLLKALVDSGVTVKVTGR